MIVAATLALALLAQDANIDWAALPGLPYRAPPIVTPGMNEFAAREAVSRKCPLPDPSGPNQTISVDIAVLVDASGDVRTVVPKAIDCATVEQFAAGLAAGFARGNLLPRAGAASEQWYRTTVTFSWRK
ncbi:hypothetical protein TPR58_10490 [Sphingomonas sp. HF-S3]|uniref:TonB C-terminal domain-containing protein n=1 Tax=Sphingomonas rustica TaxID=3103142 RepID=A0ABV0BB35_9SPHN